MPNVSSLLVPAVLFFALGFFAQFIKSDLKFPSDFTKSLTIYLLVCIGLHGGIELSHVDASQAIAAIIAALALGFGLPILAYGILKILGKLDALNAAAIAAHYGSVSAGTFLSAIAFLDAINQPHEPYPVIMLAIMESPAIIVGLLLASVARRQLAVQQVDSGKLSKEDQSKAGHYRELLKEAFTNGSVILLIGGMLIGMSATEKSLGKILPLFDSMFMGGLCLFLLSMGMEAAKRLNEFKQVGKFLVAFGILMPILGGMIGLFVGHQLLGFSVGGTTLVAVLAASASYIAVPPAMRMAIPEANPSLYLTLSLGITFPFNVLFGIPLYYQLAQWIAR